MDRYIQVGLRLFAHRHGLRWDTVQELLELVDNVGVNRSIDLWEASGRRKYTEAEMRVVEEYNANEAAVAAAFLACQSPLEELFLAQLAESTHLRFFAVPKDGFIGEIPRFDVCVGQQLKVAGLKADFAFSSEERLLLVELDGHEFHERTKAQATRDKARDRKLQAAGASVFRFTGSEVFKNPAACVKQCLDLLKVEEEA